MAVADVSALPIAIHLESAAPHEVILVEPTLEPRLVCDPPKRLIGNKAYGSDKLGEKLNKQGVEMIAPHKRNRKKPMSQDGRKLRRYRKRWKIERLWPWLQNFRRILVRQDYLAENYLGFVHLACIKILLRCF